MAHANLDTLLNKRQAIGDIIEVGALYYHYRNSAVLYKVIAVGFQEATEELCVIYQNIQKPDLIWVRNFDDWNSPVEYQGKITARFIKK